MASEGEVWVQLSDVSVMDFVVSALQDKLGREARGGRERRRARAS